MKTLKINKLDAARRQLGTAIELWFSGGDPISTHTLVGAAYQILCDLLRHRGLPDFLHENPRIRPEHRREYRRAVRAAVNFLKHADEDPDAEFEIDVEINGFHILQCLIGLLELDEQFTAAESAFWARFGLEYPQLLNEDHPFAHAVTSGQFHDVGSLSRAEFYALCKANAATQ